MKKKANIAFCTIFIFILLLNVMKPLSSDDYFFAFIWPEGVKLNGLLPENAARITSLEDICKSVREYYFIWGGRLPAQSLMTFFVWQGKALFNILNSFVFLLLIAEIYWLSHEGRVHSLGCRFLYLFMDGYDCSCFPYSLCSQLL